MLGGNFVPTVPAPSSTSNLPKSITPAQRHAIEEALKRADRARARAQPAIDRALKRAGR
jgi:hypothetical protein